MAPSQDEELTRDLGTPQQHIMVRHKLSRRHIRPRRRQPHAGKHDRVFREWAGSSRQRTDQVPKHSSAIYRPIARDEVGDAHDGDQHIAMCYVCGIAGDRVCLRKHAETRRRGEAEHPEEERLGPEKRRGKSAEDGVEDVQKIDDLVLHVLDCCEAWRARKILADTRKLVLMNALPVSQNFKTWASTYLAVHPPRPLSTYCMCT